MFFQPLRKMALTCVLVIILTLTTAAVDANYSFDANDFAVEVISSTNLNDTGLLDNPNAVLGRPTLRFFNPPGPFGPGGFRRTKLVEPAFNVDEASEDVLTSFAVGQSITVRMGRVVENDPLNPFGIDLIVFGNVFFTGSGTVTDATNLNTYALSGGAFTENVQVSVSPDLVDWYTYDGISGDDLYPTNSFIWDSDNAQWTDVEADPTLPIDPALLGTDVSGMTAAQVLDDIYGGSAGGVGFDLAVSGFDSIEYVRFSGVSGFSGGEIDAVADVEAIIPEPASITLLGVAGMALLRRRRAQ